MDYCNSDFDKTKLFRTNATDFTKSKLIAERACLRFGAFRRLYEYFRSIISNVLNDSIKSKLTEYEGEMLIRTYVKVWQRIILIIHYARRIFTSIEREASN